MWEVLLTSGARIFFERSEAALQRRFDRAFALLRIDPRRHPNIKRLTGKFAGYFRFRVGDWRLIYLIDDAKTQVWIVDIAHRREIYE